MELRNVLGMEKPSALANEFVTLMKDINEQVKDKLQHSKKKYKEYADRKRRAFHF